MGIIDGDRPAHATADAQGQQRNPPPDESLEDVAAEHLEIWCSGATVPIRRKEVRRILDERIALRARVVELEALVESGWREGRRTGWSAGNCFRPGSVGAYEDRQRTEADWLNSDTRKALLAGARKE